MISAIGVADGEGKEEQRHAGEGAKSDGGSGRIPATPSSEVRVLRVSRCTRRALILSSSIETIMRVCISQGSLVIKRDIGG